MSCHAIGALSLRWFSSSGWSCRDNPLIVNCSIACELSDHCGSFDYLLDPFAPHVFERFSHGQLCWNTAMKLVAPVSRPTFLAAWPKPMLHFSSCLLAQSLCSSSRKFAASTAYSTLCQVRVASLTTSVATSAADLFLVPARIPTSCDNVSTFSKSN